MMKKDPKIFADVGLCSFEVIALTNLSVQYHDIHRVLTSAWPTPPLPILISLLSTLPAHTVIVDLGCGDAGLAKALVPQGKIVLSFDLVGDRGVPGAGSVGGWVVEADFLHAVPLPGRRGGTTVEAACETTVAGKKQKMSISGHEDSASEVVDAVVCCLSLMGVNWVGGIYEASRILKQG